MEVTPRNYELLAANVSEETKKAAEDPVYFINTYCSTFDPRTQRKDLAFNLYPFQEDTVRRIWELILSGRSEDLFIEKSRDMGATWLALAAMLHIWLFIPGHQFLIGSRKEDAVDNWQMDTLFPKLQYLIERSPFRPSGYNSKKDRKFMKYINRENGNLFSGESANPDFARSGRYNAALFDEIAFWPWAQSSWEAAGDSTPCRIGITTPSSQPSYAKQLRNSGKTTLISLHWRLHPKKDQEWYDNEKLRRTAEELAREIDINWEGSLEGIVYPEISNAEVGTFPFIGGQGLYTGWDFGLDGTPIQWWQINPKNGKWRLINSYENKDKVIEYFLPFFGAPIDSIHAYSPADLELIREMSQLPKPTHFGDPDVDKRSYLTGSRTREVLEHAGIYINTDTKANDLDSRKTATKLLFQGGIEVNDTPQNLHWLECIQNSRYPKRQDTSQSTTPNLKPIHDWTSHHRTATEYFAVNRPLPIKHVNHVRRERRYDKITGRLIS